MSCPLHGQNGAFGCVHCDAAYRRRVDARAQEDKDKAALLARVERLERAVRRLLRREGDSLEMFDD